MADRDAGARDSLMLVIDQLADPDASTREQLPDGLSEDCKLELFHERKQLERLRELIARMRVEPRPGFADEVMAAVHRERQASDLMSAKEAVDQEIAADLERSSPRPMVVSALAAAALLMVVAAALVGTGNGTGGLVGTAAAVGDFAWSTLLAGAGLLTASWQGVGATVGAWLRESTLNLVIGLALVVGLNLLLFHLLRRRVAASARRRK